MKSAPPLGAVLLAAGAASRFGGAKQVADFHGLPLVRRAAQAILNCGAELLVVTGAHAELVAAALSGLQLRLTHNALWHLGMGESIAHGFRALSQQPAAPTASLLCLADQPLIGSGELQRLIERHLAQPLRIIVSDYGDTQGPPCLFPAEFYDELCRLSGAAGARKILERHPQAVVRVAMPEAAMDIDWPSDHARALTISLNG